MACGASLHDLSLEPAQSDPCRGGRAHGIGCVACTPSHFTPRPAGLSTSSTVGPHQSLGCCALPPHGRLLRRPHRSCAPGLPASMALEFGHLATTAGAVSARACLGCRKRRRVQAHPQVGCLAALEPAPSLHPWHVLHALRAQLWERAHGSQRPHSLHCVCVRRSRRTGLPCFSCAASEA